MIDFYAIEESEEGKHYIQLLNNRGSRHVPKNDAEALSKYGITDWIEQGNTPTPYVGPTDLENWELEMENSDRTLSRAMEDMLDGMPDKSGVAQITLDRLQAKKDLRATKP